MTQSQIVQALAEKCEVTKKVSQGLLTALSDTAIREVKKNGVFVLPGIGRLVRVDRKGAHGTQTLPLAKPSRSPPRRL